MFHKYKYLVKILTAENKNTRLTGCNSQFRKIFEFKIWKESMLALKQKMLQQKALDLKFKMTPLIYSPGDILVK